MGRRLSGISCLSGTSSRDVVSVDYRISVKRSLSGICRPRGRSSQWDVVSVGCRLCGMSSLWDVVLVEYRLRGVSGMSSKWDASYQRHVDLMRY